jgi:hypothetical protein
MKKHLYRILTVILTGSSQAGFLDDINHASAPKGVLSNSKRIAEDSLFESVGAIFSGPLDGGVFFTSSAVLISPTMALSAKHCFEKWDEGHPTHQFFFGFPKDPSSVEIEPINFRIVSKIVGFKDQDIVLLYLDEPVTHIKPASIIEKEEYVSFFSKVSSSSLASPLPATERERTCGIFAGYSISKTASDLQKMSLADVGSFFSSVPQGGPKTAGAIQLRHYDKAQSLLVSNFVDFPAEGRQEPFSFKGSKASIASIIPGDSGSGVFFEVAGQWKLVAIASSTSDSKQPITELIPGVHMLFSNWSPIRLSLDRLEKATLALESKKARFGRPSPS